MTRTAGFFALVAVVALGLLAVATSSSRSATTPIPGQVMRFTGSDLDEVERLVGYHIPQPRDATGWRIKEILVFPRYLELPDPLPPFVSTDTPSGPICTPDVDLCLTLHYTSNTSGDVLVNVHDRISRFPRPKPPQSPSSQPVETHHEAVTVGTSPAILEATTIQSNDQTPILTSIFIQWRLGKLPLSAASATQPANTPITPDNQPLMTRQALIAFLASFQ